MTQPSRQRGVALLTAIILVALAAVLAVAIGFSSAMAARRGASVFSVEQGLLFAEGAEAFAAYVFSQDKTNQDALSEPWATPFPPTEVAPGVAIAGRIQDEAGKFNLNSLVGKNGNIDELAYQEFTYLLQILGLPALVAERLVDWLDADAGATGSGGEDSLYLSQNPPHLTPNFAVTSISELLQFPGLLPEHYRELAPFVTALPPGTRLNLCTASAQVLDAMISALIKNLQTQYMNDPELGEKQKKGCFPQKDVFLAQLEDPQKQLGNLRVAETSDYFRLSTVVSLGTTQFALYSLLAREQGTVRPIIRTYGTD